MRTKINAGQTIGYRSGIKNDLFRKFNRQFSVLLNPEKDYTGKTKDSSSYIKNVALEEEMLSTIYAPTDGFYYLMGFTGIGKTTFIQHTFNCFDNNPTIVDSTLIIPTFCDSSHFTDDTLHNRIAAKIDSAILSLQDSYSLFYSDEMLYKFIYETKRELLGLGDDRRNLDHQGRLDALFSKSRFAYETERLKYFLNQLDMRNIILILDDIESLSWKHEKIFVSSFLRLYDCLKNNEERTYKVKILISGRQYSYRLLSKEEWFSAYGLSDEFVMDTAPNLSDIFEARFNEVNNQIAKTHEPKNKEEWQRSYEILQHVSSKLYTKYGITILELNNYNIREALKDFKDILSNRRWMQKNQNPSASFKIDELNFAVTNISVLAALAYGEGDQYFDEYHPIANLLHNEQVDDCELLLIYIVKFLLINEHQTVRHGFPICELSYMLGFVDSLFPIENIGSRFEKIIQYMLKRKLIFPSPDDSSENPSKVFLTPRGVALWKLLPEHSFLLELYREDIWRDDVKYSPKKTVDLSLNDLFNDIIKYTEELFDVEKRNLQYAISVNKLNIFHNIFGEDLICKRLLSSINASKYFFPTEMSNSTLKSKINELKINIDDFEEIIRKSKSTFVS
jgi:hypothetical protein